MRAYLVGSEGGLSKKLLSDYSANAIPSLWGNGFNNWLGISYSELCKQTKPL